jgi:uncharacterized protein YndB with AHSA1/START domain
MTTGDLIDVDGRPALRFERTLPHSVERVWRAVTEPSELAQWFVGPVAWTPSLGETFEVEGQHVTITALEPPHRIAWDWADEHYAFELGDSPRGCVLRFTHVFSDRYGPAAQHAAGWETYLDRLDALLTGHPIDEIEAHVPIAELHEHYAAAFGQDPAPGRRMIATLPFRDLTLERGPVLRLERRFRHPVERVWRAIDDPDERAQWFPEDEPLTVVDRQPPRLLVGTWFGDTLQFELVSEPAGCRLVFTHAFTDRALAARTGAGWHRCFARFDALLAGHPMDTDASLDAWTEVHERYAEAWDVDPEIGRAAIADFLASR